MPFGPSEPLARALARIAAAPTRAELKVCAVDGARTLLGARGAGFYLLDRDGLRATDLEVDGLPPKYVDAYEAGGRAVDPLLPRMARRQAPVHEREFYSDEQWLRFPIVGEARAALGWQHYLLAPLVGHGRVVGTLNLSRGAADRAFGDDDLALAAALAMHASVKLALLDNKPTLGEVRTALSPREADIAHLVAQGLTNRAIGDALAISENTVKAALKQIFRRLDVVSRADLVRRLHQR